VCLHILRPAPRDCQDFIMSPFITETAPGPKVTTALVDAAPHLYEDPGQKLASVDPFTVTTLTGFMPIQPPVVDLPSAFAMVAQLAEEMPVTKLDGTPGLLATYQLGPIIDSKVVPDLTDEVDKLTTTDGKLDLPSITAVFRDYAFLASAYLLEPCWERWSKGLEGYGLGREVLPACLARPLVKTANM
jgi:indoleamine 2,3-dioxygenase